MHLWKPALIFLVTILFIYAVSYGLSAGLYYLFIFPLFAVGVFLTFYLSNQFEKDEERQVEKKLQYIADDIEAEKWVNNSLAPTTMKYIQTRRWTIVLYCAFFFFIATFVWNFLINGLAMAVRDLIYTGLMFWTFVMYVFIAPALYDKIQKRLPKSIKNTLAGDWERGYFFLLPITILIYLIYPFATLQSQFSAKIITLPYFFIVYTFAFVCLYYIVYMYRDMQADETTKERKELKKMLKDRGE